MILIIASTSSFIMNQRNPFPGLTAPCPLIFLSSLSIIGKSALVTNLGKTSLTKGTANFVSLFVSLFLIYLSYYQEIHLLKYFLTTELY